MKLRKIILLLLLCAIFIPEGNAQEPINDTCVAIYSIGVTLGSHFPGGDLKSRYGFSNTIGPSFYYKSASNWILSAEAGLLFGKKVKDIDAIIKQIATSDHYVINEGGIYTDIVYLERGFSAQISGGKLFPIFGSNKNSGLAINLGVGYLLHKIKFEQNENSTPQLSGDYKKGYDRLSHGMSLYQFIGYQHYSENNLKNFCIGLEFIQARTFSLRPYNFDEMRRPTEKRIDILYGLKIGWIIPLGNQNHRKSHEY